MVDKLQDLKRRDNNFLVQIRDTRTYEPEYKDRVAKNYGYKSWNEIMAAGVSELRTVGRDYCPECDRPYGEEES